MARGVAAQVAACPRAPGRVAGWARGRAMRSWPSRVRPRRARPWRGVVAELRHAAVRRQADNTCSRGGRDGQRRATCTWTWRIEERGHRDLGGGGYPACARRASQDAVRALSVARGRYLAQSGTRGGSIARPIVARSHGGRRAMQAACVLRRLTTMRVFATHGSPPVSPMGSWKFLENPHWSKLRSAERRVCLLRVIVDC